MNYDLINLLFCGNAGREFVASASTVADPWGHGWPMVSAIAAALATGAVIITLIIICCQLNMQRKTLHADLLWKMLCYVQEERFREARKKFFRLVEQEPEQEFSDWDQEKKDAAQTSIIAYTTAAVMLKNGYMKPMPFLKAWRGSVERTHQKAGKYIEAQLRPRDPHTVELLEYLVDEIGKLEKAEAKKKRKKVGGTKPSDKPPTSSAKPSSDVQSVTSTPAAVPKIIEPTSQNVSAKEVQPPSQKRRSSQPKPRD